MSQYNDYYSNLNNQGGGGYGGGGGYLPGNSDSQFGSQSPGGARKNTQNSIRPITIKQALNATQAHTDAELFIDDFEVSQLTIVAQVISYQVQPTNGIYWLDDGTGRIEARHWMDTSSDEETEKWTGFENQYVRVTGILRHFGTKRFINATHIRVITEHHEIFFHLLECMTAYIALQRGPPPRPGQLGNGNQNSGVIQIGPQGYSSYNAPNAINTDQYSHLPPLERKIMDYLISQQPNDTANTGTHAQTISRSMNTDPAKISLALEKLLDEGHVFTTIDDFHFAPSM